MEFIPEVVVSVRKALRLERYKYEERDIILEGFNLFSLEWFIKNIFHLELLSDYFPGKNVSQIS